MDKPTKETPENSPVDRQASEVKSDGIKDGVTMQQQGVTVPEEWRELVLRIQKETDTQKLVNLVQELIGKFDEDKMRKALRRPGSTP